MCGMCFYSWLRRWSSLALVLCLSNTLFQKRYGLYFNVINLTLICLAFQLVEVGVVKVTIKRSELDASMQSANRRRSVVGRQRSTKRMKASQVAPAMADE